MSISYVRQMPEEPIFVIGFEGQLDPISLHEGISRVQDEGRAFGHVFVIVDTRETLSSFADVQAALSDEMYDLGNQSALLTLVVVSSVQMIKTRRYLHAIGDESADVEFAQYSNIPNALTAVRAEIAQEVLSL
jgi:hypothetical protein